MTKEEFLQRVLVAYRKDFINLGFIPAPRLKRDYEKGRFFISDDGFILIGSPKSEFTPIMGVYIYPEKRNGSTDKVVRLLEMLPEKKYRVSCCIGLSFWKRVGLKQVGIKTSNSRKRQVYVLEGELSVMQPPI